MAMLVACYGRARYARSFCFGKASRETMRLSRARPDVVPPYFYTFVFSLAKLLGGPLLLPLGMLLLRVALILFVGSGLLGCRHVAPYERAKLAHHTMQMSSPSGPGEEHMFAVHEGANGGSGAGGGGCGCN